jgi:hypothetical protein
MTCPHRVQFPDSCPACEAAAELAAEQRAEADAELWTRRGERWAEDVVYGEIE